MKKLVSLLFVFLLLAGCSSKKKIITKKKRQDNRVAVEIPDEKIELEPIDPQTKIKIPNSTEDYIRQYRTIAIEEMQKHKIPASITLAQGILESGSGKGRLAVEANNHFGIKCHSWTGQKIYHDDDRRQECFRKYKDARQSFKDHSDFLVNRKRYAKLFNLKITDYKGWAKELRHAGYATDRRYPQKLISIIERYKLYRLDGNSSVVAEEQRTHLVEKGDTLYSIARRYNVSVDDLKAWNNLDDTAIIEIGQELKIKH